MPSSAYVRTLPKVQLHCHLEGSVAPQTFRKLAARHGVDIGVRGVGPPEDSYAFSTFGEFLLLFAEVCKTLRTPEDFADVARIRKALALRHAQEQTCEPVREIAADEKQVTVLEFVK